MVEHLSDKEIENLNRGGHDPLKVFNAYKKATESKGKPSVVLAFMIGIWHGFRQADNAAHQVKKLSKENLKDFAENFNLPFTDDELENPAYDLSADKKALEYLHEQRKKLGGLVPSRKVSN